MDPRSFYQHSEFLMQTPIPLSQSNLQPDFFQFFTNNNSQQLFLPVNHKTPSHIISSSLAPTRGTTDSTTVSNSSADHLNTPLSDENSDFSEIPFPTQNQTKTSSQLPTTSSQQHHLTNSHENPSSQDYDDETNSEHSQEDREALLNKGWKDSDDTQLLSLAKKYKCDWKKISKKFNNKKFTPYFLKIRYKDLINAPVQKKHKFTHNEDLQLAVLFEKHGSDWKTISQFFKHRTGVMLKNRYYSFIRKKDLLKTLLDEASGLTKPKIEESEDSQDESHIVKVEAESENLCLQTIEKSFITSNKVYDFDNVEFEQSLFGIMTNQDEELHTRITPMEIPVFEKPIVPSTNFQYNQNAWMMNSQFHYYSEYGMNRFQGMQTLPRY